MTRADTTDLANEVRIACQRVSRRVRFESGGELAPHHVSALSTLKHGPKTPSELAEAERVSAPSMTKTVGCLVERGLVASADNPADGRSKLLSLTEAGWAELEAVRRARDDWMARKLEGLSQEERNLLKTATGLLNRVLER
jgi:DNA-binding MarR family transcriptional regulator